MKDKKVILVAELGDMIAKVLKGKGLLMGEADYILDMTYIAFVINSMMNVENEDWDNYIKERLDKFGQRLSHAVNAVKGAPAEVEKIRRMENESPTLH